jgi:tetratricopeptide (TPR) repeat protein
VIASLALLLAAASAPPAKAPAPQASQADFSGCTRLTDSDPAAAAKIAVAWAAQGGGVPAARCLGLARSAQDDWKGAADAFTAGAEIADKTHDRRAADMWVSAGNAALAGGDFARAQTALSSAIANPALPGKMKGEALVDRARTHVAANDLPGARADLNDALALVPDDPMAWLLSATLARRMGETTRASDDIKEAMLRAPNEADVLFEAGNIAATNGDMGGARMQWTRATTADPRSDAAASARAELVASGGVAQPPPAPNGR